MLRTFKLTMIVLFLVAGTYMIGCDGLVGVVVNESGESNWTFTEDNVSFGISGVSPEAIVLGDGSVRLYVTDMGIKVYKASDGLTFTQESGSLPQGSDPTLIQLNDGSYRMYYVDMVQGVQEISTATSSDGLNWIKESNTGISNTTGGPAWGVPDSIEIPSGSIRLYWVDAPAGDSNHHLEVIKSAIATDGLNFTVESGYRTQGGYVDPYILLAQDGNWIGLFATTPAPEFLPQKIYVGTSTDGLSWSIEGASIITAGDGNALDPTAVPLGDGSYRVYYSATSGSNPFSGFLIKSGILRRK
ncbi:MAG: hypothetical protein JSV03_12340 [Planctomycetota bacterium]|nr:MAG: hypothetical protein JSV03_12340 [Planctomycetota bacterium]